MAKVLSSPLFRLFIAAALAGGFIFLGTTSVVNSFRNAVFGFVYAVSQNPIGAFLFPRGALVGNMPHGSFREIESLRFELENLKKENDDLRAAARVAARQGFSGIGADAFFYTNELGKESVLINKGGKDGIEKGAFVVDSYALFVGTVADVGEHTARVDVASNAGNTFEVVILPTNTRAVARGLGGGVFMLDLVPIDMPVRSGDFVGIVPKRTAPSVHEALFFAEIVGESQTNSTVFKAVRAVSPVLPSQVGIVFVIP